MTRVVLRGAEQWHPAQWTLPPEGCGKCRVHGYYSQAATDHIFTTKDFWIQLWKCRYCGTVWQVEERRMLAVDDEYATRMMRGESPPTSGLTLPKHVVGLAEGEWDRADDGRIILPEIPQQAYLDPRGVGKLHEVEVLTVLADVLATRGNSPSGRSYRFTFQTQKEWQREMQVTRDGYGIRLRVPLDFGWLGTQVVLQHVSSADGATGLTTAIGEMSQWHAKRGPAEITTTRKPGSCRWNSALATSSSGATRS